jgi:hypothetical protein
MFKVNWMYGESAHKYATEPKILQYGFTRNVYARTGIFISNGTCFHAKFVRQGMTVPANRSAANEEFEFISQKS